MRYVWEYTLSFIQNAISAYHSVVIIMTGNSKHMQHFSQLQQTIPTVEPLGLQVTDSIHAHVHVLLLSATSPLIEKQ